MAIEYKTTTYRTCTGENDGSGLLVELSLAQTHKLSGTLKEITIPIRSSGLDGSIIPTYLSIHLEQFDGTWLQVAVSNNAVTPVAGGTSVWSFDGIILNGRRIRLIPVATKDGEQQSRLYLHYKFIVSSDGSQIKYGYAWYGHLPDITFTIENTLFVPDEKPEPEVELREIDIRNYWPPVVRDTDEFQQIAAALNPEFNTLQACIYRVLQDAFVHDATDYGVRRWESILGISPAVGDTLDDRKARIITYLNIKLPYTWRVLKQMLTEFLSDEQWVMEYINDECKLILHTDHISDDKLQTIKTLLENVVPQNIEVEVNENE